MNKKELYLKFKKIYCDLPDKEIQKRVELALHMLEIEKQKGELFKK